MSGTFRSPWKRSRSAGARSRDLSLQSESPPTPFYMSSGVSLVGVGEQEPLLYLLCEPAKLSAALQVPSQVGTAVWSLGPLDRDFLPGLSVPQKWKDCQLIQLCCLLGLTATHPLQTKAPLSR